MLRICLAGALTALTLLPASARTTSAAPDEMAFTTASVRHVAHGRQTKPAGRDTGLSANEGVDRRLSSRGLSTIAKGICIGCGAK